MRWAARPGSIIGWTLTAAATYAAVFVLPYRFPLSEPVLSDTWIAGANNLVAAMALAVLSVVVTLFCWFRSPTLPDTETARPIARRYLYAAILVSTLWTACLGWAVSQRQMYWGDEGYFLNQLRSGLVFHQQLYTGFEFAYGPLLYLCPAACIRLLTPLGISFTAAYVVSLALMQAVGLALAFYMVQALPLRRPYQRCALALITCGTFNSLLGLNYSIFRFILPFAAIVLLSRQRSIARTALVAVVGEIVCLATSPELGVAFAGAAIVYAIYRGTTEHTRWLAATLAPIAGAGLFYLVVSPAYLFTLGEMAKGGYNLLLRPAPHVLALLVAAVVLTPITVGRHLRSRDHAAMMVAFYVAALAMLPAALGRPDAIHTFFDGLGLYLLSLITLNALSLQARRISIVLFATTFILVAVHNGRSSDQRLRILLHPHAVQEDWAFDEAALRRAIGSATISAPILAPQRVLDDLTRTGQYLPGHFCGWVGVWDRGAEERKIADMRRAEYALVAFTDPVYPDPDHDREIRTLLRMGFAMHPLRPAYIRGALLDTELQAHWVERGRFGDYELYQKQK